MKLFVVSPPAGFNRYTAVHMEYCIGRGFCLYRTERTLSLSGGIMGIDCTNCSDSGSVSALTDEIINECTARNFSGVLLEIPQSPDRRLISLVQALDTALAQQNLLLFIRESAAQYTKYAKILVGTALSGGTLTGHLQSHISAFGAQRIALDIERVRMDFTLPAHSGVGIPLSAAEFSSLYRRYRASSFFSNELCANYFRYRQNSSTHFVLYDNAYSIKRKITVASQLGIQSALVYYPEVSDIINSLS